MPVAPTTIPPIPTPVPSTDDPGNFDARADATLGALPPAVDGMNAVATNVYANATEVFTKAAEIDAAAMVASDAAGLVGRSNSPLVVGAGTKSVTLLAAKPNLVVLNKRVVIVQISDPSIKMFGTISSVTSSTAFAVTVVSSGAFGSGNYSSWQIIDAAFFGSAATKELIWAALDDTAAITSKSLGEARAPVAVAFSSSVVLPMNAGISFVLGLITGNFQLANPTGLADVVGQSGSVTLPLDATGTGLISYGTYWKPVEGTHIAMAPGANKTSTLYYEVKSATRIEYSMGRNFLA